MEYEKKYTAALERAAKLRVQNPFDTVGQMVEHIFPELKESEEERIRKWLINEIKIKHHNLDEENIEFVDKAIAWLEKQSEQTHAELGQSEAAKTSDQELSDKVEPKFKPGDTMRTWREAANGYTDGMPVVVSIDNEYYHCTNELIAIKDQDDYEFPPINVKQKSSDKVEPKFKIGDWVVCEITGLAYQIKNCSESLNNHKFGYDLTNGGYIGSDEVNLYHLWTIEDAKSGDVLVDADGNIGMFDKCYDFEWMSFCSLGNRGFRYFTVEHENEKTHPATKEQSELLFQKMKEAGWELDTEEKVLKKIKYKFNVNDWIVTDDSFGKIVRHIDKINLINEEYIVSDENRLYYILPFSYEHKWHKWTIQDAEDGDLLAASDNSIFIYAGTDGFYAKFYIAMTTFGTFNLEGGRWEDKDGVRPVTEEERKTFFEKLKGKRLEWDLKNKCIHYMASC